MIMMDVPSSILVPGEHQRQWRIPSGSSRLSHHDPPLFLLLLLRAEGHPQEIENDRQVKKKNHYGDVTVLSFGLGGGINHY